MRTPSSTSRNAFSIMEAMVTMAIIALLAGLVFAAVRHVKSSGDIAAERAMVVTLKQGVEHFRQEFNFLPPLVVDLPDDPIHPVTTAGVIQVWSSSDLYDPNTSLNLSTGPNDRHCYSQYSLAYYLTGSLGNVIDGVEGYGFTAPTPSHDGTFTIKGRKYDPIVDTTRFKTRAGVVRAFLIRPAGTEVTAPDLDRAVWHRRTIILDRWSDSSGLPPPYGNGNDRPIRYYRWESSYYTGAGGADPAPSPGQVGQVHYWNIPVAVGGDPINTNPPKNPELKSATWAIVSAGVDRKFGDESSTGDPAAAMDNIVEVGR